MKTEYILLAVHDYALPADGLPPAVEAEIVDDGRFGIHRKLVAVDYPLSQTTWTATHIPTGREVKAVRSSSRRETKRKLLDLIDRIEDAGFYDAFDRALSEAEALHIALAMASRKLTV